MATWRFFLDARLQTHGVPQAFWDAVNWKGWGCEYSKVGFRKCRHTIAQLHSCHTQPWNCQQLFALGFFKGFPSSSQIHQQQCHDANPINSLLWGSDLFDSVKSLFVKTAACREIWDDVWRTRWQRQVTVTASVPLWIVNARSDTSSEDLQTTLPILLNLPATTTGLFEAGERKRGRKSSVAAHHVEWKLGWHLLAGMKKPNQPSRGVTWFLVECQVMSRVLLKDESKGEDNSPDTTTRHDITLENDKKHILTRQMIPHHVAMFTWQKSSKRIKQARNSPKRTSESCAGGKKSNLASTAFSATDHLPPLSADTISICGL